MLAGTRTRGLAALLSCALAFIPVGHALPGQPGTLDASWATLSPLGAGKVITPVAGGDDFGSAMALQPDGKVLVAGSCTNASNNRDFCAIRYNADGTLDITWAANSALGAGKVMTPIGSGYALATTIALQSDGKALLAGRCVIVICMLRYNADGTLDASFGNSGTILSSVQSESADAMAVQPDGKIVLVGKCVNSFLNQFCALRYNANGTPDTSFNNTGKIVTTISGGSEAKAVAMQTDGKILVAGWCWNGSNYDFCALRYNANGTLDTTWAAGSAIGAGKAQTAIGSSNDHANAMALQPDGKVVLAGNCIVATPSSFCALRYNTNGTLDLSFGSGGTVVTAVGDDARVFGVVVQPDGKIVLAGYCDVGGNRDFCALRYHGNGVVDTTFGNNGVVITGIGVSADGALAVALQPDGKLLLGGQCIGAVNTDFCVARYDGGPFGYKACSLDIDGDGRVLPMTDSLIHARIALGIIGPAVIGGITFPPTATRNTWPLIRDYLVTQCGMSLPPP